MFKILLLLLVAVPLADFFLLFKIGESVGLSQVMLIVLVTGFAGAVLYRIQMHRNTVQTQQTASQGMLPDVEIVDRFLIYGGMILMVLPGLITDFLGLSLLLPVSRPWIRDNAKEWLKEKIKSSNIQIQMM